MHLTNLDAMLRREDFEIRASSKPETQELVPSFKVSELEDNSLFYAMLRKPDFQRTTAHWSPEKVSQFIRSFLEGDLIPAIIVWRSNTSGNVFVIDGAHRVSALMAWVHNDYGDQSLSVPFFENFVPPEQKKAADTTRELIRHTVGSYSEIKAALKPESHASQQHKSYAQTLATVGIKLQWVPGDAMRAERSFHTINGQQTPIGQTELRLIRDRRSPNAIATRALIRAGTGNTYVSSFSQDNQDRIRVLARQVYDDLFVPALDTPIKTLDLPVAGRGYSSESVRLILDLVEYANPIRHGDSIAESKRPKGKKTELHEPTMDADTDGAVTIRFLDNVRKATSRIAGNMPRSLGLHPAVYFYSATGNYQPTAFLAAIGFVENLETGNALDDFTTARYDFEELLLRQKHFINKIVKQYGSGTRGLTAMIRLFHHLYDGAVKHIPDSELVPSHATESTLDFLKPIIDSDKGVKKAFTSDRKSAVFLRKAIDSAVRCGICRARVHRVSNTIDHIVRLADGGTGHEDNGQIAHPYCNSGYKEKATHNVKLAERTR